MRTRPDDSNDPIDLAQLTRKPIVGTLLRQRRIDLQLSQAKVAARLHITASALAQYESGRRTPPSEMLKPWCSALDLPFTQLRKLLSIAAAGLYRLEVGTWPPDLSRVERERLRALNVPAWYHATPSYDILDCNAAARERVPWLVPAPLTSRRPTNLIERFFREEWAPRVIVNFDQVVTRVLIGFRILAPGVVPASRIAEIIQTCRANPDFDRLWSAELTEEEMAQDHVVFRDPATGAESTWTMGTFHSVWPSESSLGSYELFMLTPRDAAEDSPHRSTVFHGRGPA